MSRTTVADEGVRLATVKHRGEVLEWKTVPKQWHQHETRVDTVAANLRQRYRTTEAVESVGLTSTDRTVAGRSVTCPVIYIDNSADAPSVPSEVNGISIERRRMPNPQPDACYNKDYDTVPGGAKLEDYNDASVFSATCPVTNSDGNERLMTCAHAFDWCDTDVVGDRLDQDGQFVGLVENGSIRQDWATIPLDGNAEVSGFDPDLAETDREVSGYVTRDGLKDLMSNDTTVYHRGKTTCETSGQVTDIEVPNKNCGGTAKESSSDYYVKTSAPTEGGDSGGPHYKKFNFNYDTKAAIIAPHYGGESIGCAAYRIHNVHGINFG